MKNLLTWECIYYAEECDSNGSTVETATIMRAKIINGWLVKNINYDYYSTDYPKISESITFVPDTNHEWQDEVK